MAAVGSKLVRYARAVLLRAARIRSPVDAWRLLTWVLAGVRRRVAAGRTGQTRSGDTHSADTHPGHTRPSVGHSRLAPYPLGAEIAAVGDRSAAVLAASARVGPPTSDRHIDLLLVDTQQTREALEASASGASRPVVAVLSEMHPRLAVPAFDPTAINPVEWTPDHGPESATLQSRCQPSAAGRALLHPDKHLIGDLRRLHHVTDCEAGPGDAAQRAGTLAALAATGVLVHLPQSDLDLRACLGAQLHDLMSGDAVTRVDGHEREKLSIAMRRMALRDHSLRARARQILETHGVETPPPVVSVLLPTRRPQLLGAAVESVRVQNYPRLELVLALHGDGFGADADIAAITEDLQFGVQVVRVEEDKPLGAVLNAAVAASSGTLLTKFDDDDYYASDHIWDLLLAREYSGATLVAKAPEYVYLSRIDSTVRVAKMRERFVPRPMAAGGVLMISRQDLDDAGGWQRVPRRVDTALARDVAQVGGDIYWTHGTGYLRVRHGDEHTWTIDDDFFLDSSSDTRQGRDFEFAGF